MNLKLNPEQYIEQVYAGWLGKVIGVRHGSNIEQWTYERIKRTYGTIDRYLFDFINFAADDDLNGPIFFIRALEDYTFTRDLTPQQIGITWLNYTGDGHGFYWWGGYGISTEHTTYLNLKHGIPAPLSGSIEQNGVVAAELILYKNNHGYQILAACSLSWELQRSYTIAVTARGSQFTIDVNQKRMLEFDDHQQPYLHGQIGFSNDGGSRTKYVSYQVQGL